VRADLPASSVVQFLASLVKLRGLVEGREATIACGKESERLPAARLADLLRLVDDAITGMAVGEPGAPGALVFSRGDLAVALRADDLPARVRPQP